MKLQDPLEPTTVEVWSRDSVLHTLHPARVIGPWKNDRTKTLLKLGETGDGLIVAAATIAGKYVVSDLGEVTFQDAAGNQVVERPNTMVALDGIGSRRMVPMGIVYLGPPCEWATQQIALAFGPQARFISHADPTAKQMQEIRIATEKETPHATIYIGVAGPFVEGVLIGAAREDLLLKSDLFLGFITPEIEQVEQAVSRIGTGELVLLEAAA